MKKGFPDKLLWVDLEMTGLDPTIDRILEVGVIITDFKFEEIEAYEAVIKQDPSDLARMKNAPWYTFVSGKREKVGTVYTMAKSNGLIDKVKDGKSEERVEKDLLSLVDKHFDSLAVLAGNSIHQDRRFIRQWWTELEKLLHYRMLDVSSFKVWMQGSQGIEFKKPDQHRALDDIRGSIAELKYYLKKLSS